MEDWHGKVVWVTGASSGIGRELAARLSGMGAWVFGSARNAAALEELQALSRVEALPCDVADRSALLAAAARIRERAGRLDVLVANAGTCEYVDVKDFDGRLFERVLAVNFLGSVYSVEAALPLLRAGSTRHIVGIGSTAAWTGLPRAEAYGASKAALHYFLDSLRVDLTREGFRVTVVAPGFVQTPLTDRNDFPMPMRIGTAQAVDYLLAGLAAGRPEIAFPPAFSRTLKALKWMPAGLRNRLYQKLVRE